MDVLTAVLAILVVIAILFEIARRLGVPFPTLFVLGGLGLAIVPGMPHITLEPELILLVFLPPLLFTAAAESPIRDLRANLAPLIRLSIGLVIFTMVIVAVVAHAMVPDLSWAAAFTLGAIVDHVVCVIDRSADHGAALADEGIGFSTLPDFLLRETH